MKRSDLEVGASGNAAWTCHCRSDQVAKLGEDVCKGSCQCLHPAQQQVTVFQTDLASSAKEKGEQTGSACLQLDNTRTANLDNSFKCGRTVESSGCSRVGYSLQQTDRYVQFEKNSTDTHERKGSDITTHVQVLVQSQSRRVTRSRGCEQRERERE